MRPREINRHILDAEKRVTEATATYHAAAHADPLALGDGYRALSAARATNLWWRGVSATATVLQEHRHLPDQDEHLPAALKDAREQATRYLADGAHEDDMPANPDELDYFTARLYAKAAQDFLRATAPPPNTGGPA